MSSTPHDASGGVPQPASSPSVDEEAEEQVESDDLEEQLDLVATKSPI
jgi:hypothetical protein